MAILIITLISLYIANQFSGHKSIKQVSTPTKIESHKLSFGFAINATVIAQPSSTRLATLKQIRSTGVTEVRFDMDWHVIQPNNKSSYRWNVYDDLLKDVKNAGLNSIITLNRTPSWARSASCKGSIACPPANPQLFADFAGVASKRYKAYNIEAWEVWNEPNINNFWEPYPDPNQYETLLKDTFIAIKAKDAGAIVLVGGLEGKANDGNKMYIDGRTFLSQLYADGAKEYFDGVAFHPYTSLRLPDTSSSRNGWLKMISTTPSIKSIMDKNGDSNKQIWITEFGAPTNGSGVQVNDLANVTQLSTADHDSAHNQAVIVKAAVKDAKANPFIRDFDWYTYEDTSSNSNDAGNFYGLLDSSGQQKEAYQIYNNSID